jgi:hypothetical protein
MREREQRAESWNWWALEEEQIAVAWARGARDFLSHWLLMMMPPRKERKGEERRFSAEKRPRHSPPETERVKREKIWRSVFVGIFHFYIRDGSTSELTQARLSLRSLWHGFCARGWKESTLLLCHLLFCARSAHSCSCTSSFYQRSAFWVLVGNRFLINHSALTEAALSCLSLALSLSRVTQPFLHGYYAAWASFPLFSGCCADKASKRTTGAPMTLKWANFWKNCCQSLK